MPSWGRLTDDDLKIAEGHAEYLSGKWQERYGMARDEADTQVMEFEKQQRQTHCPSMHHRHAFCGKRACRVGDHSVSSGIFR